MLKGFLPIVGDRPRVLILGSFPGIPSLRVERYYGHGPNAFWRVMGAILGFDPALDWPEKYAALVEAGVAVWDVIDQCEREGGSDDGRIVTATAIPNPIPFWLVEHSTIKRVVFNGQSPSRFYKKLLGPLPEGHKVAPSTSPLYAIKTVDEKIESWREALAGF